MDQGGARLGALPNTKTDGQFRPLGRAAAEFVRALQPNDSSAFAFPADVGSGRFTAAPRTLQRLCALVKLGGVTPHTLRHTFSSVAGDLGFSELTIAALLGHAARGVTQGYVHIDEPIRLAADRVSAEIAALLDQPANGVVERSATRQSRLGHRVDVTATTPSRQSRDI